MKSVLITILEAIAISVVPLYWSLKLAIKLACGVLAFTILALLVFLAIAPSWHGVAILGEFVSIFAVARAIDLIVREATKAGVKISTQSGPRPDRGQDVESVEEMRRVAAFRSALRVTIPRASHGGMAPWLCGGRACQ